MKDLLKLDACHLPIPTGPRAAGVYVSKIPMEAVTMTGVGLMLAHHPD